MAARVAVRVVDSYYGNGSFTNNKARADMQVISTEDLEYEDDENGDSVTVDSGTTQASVFNDWDAAIWNISGNLTVGAALPTLKSITQNPAPVLP